MDFDLTDDQAAWRASIRAFLDLNLTPELRAELATHAFTRSPLVEQFQKPEAYGGAESLRFRIDLVQGA